MKEIDKDFLKQVKERQATLKKTCETLYSNTNGPLMLEIGSGHGHFLVAYALAHPQTHCTGIDIQGPRVDKSIKKQERESLENLHFIKAEAVEFLSILPKAVLYNEVYILFPDPWPKQRHHKNRLIQPEFLSLIASKCSPNAKLYFRTDHEDYFKWSHKIFTNHQSWQLTEEHSLPVEEETVFQRRMGSFQTLVAEKN